MFWLDSYKPVCLNGRRGTIVEIILMAILLSILFLGTVMTISTVPAVLT